MKKKAKITIGVKTENDKSGSITFKATIKGDLSNGDTILVMEKPQIEITESEDAPERYTHARNTHTLNKPPEYSYITRKAERTKRKMKKTPYTMALLIPTLSPAAIIAVFDERGAVLPFPDPIYKGKAIKARDNDDLLRREVKHIGINEVTDKAAGATIDIFVY